jgi:hypothetical protein
MQGRSLSVEAEIQVECGKGIERVRIPDNSSIHAALIPVLGWL